MKKYNAFFAIPYFLWLVFFVLAPVILIVGYSFFDSNGNFTLQNYATYFASGKYLAMTFNSVLYAFLITLLTHQLSDGIFSDEIEAPRFMAAVDYFADVDQYAAQSLCIYRNLQSARRNQPVHDFLRTCAASDLVY